VAAQRLEAGLKEASNDCLALRARIVARAVTSIYDDALRPHDLKISQMNVLVAAGRYGPVRPVELARVLHLDASTLSRNLDRLHDRGLIETLEDEEDARAAPVQLTGEGKKIVQKVMPAWRKAQKEAETLLGGTGAKALKKLGDSIVAE
jgi:DNA-binding MarR family transcriptional regulator